MKSTAMAPNINNCLNNTTTNNNNLTNFKQNSYLTDINSNYILPHDTKQKNNNKTDGTTQNTIKLSLKKPKNWNWELTTSKSSSSIYFPKILLYDNKGDLLVETDKPDSVFSSRYDKNSTIYNTINDDDIKNNNDNNERNSIKIEHGRSKSLNDNENEKKLKTLRKPKRSKSTNLCDIDENTNVLLNSLCNQFESKGIDFKITRRKSNEYLPNHSEKNVIKNFPVEKIITKTVTEKQESKSNENLLENICLPNCNFHIQKSKSAMDVHPKKSLYRRTNSTNLDKRFSTSILERISAFKQRSSSSESQDTRSKNETNFEEKPKYTLRTSKAGTLVVCEESFRNRKVRRRTRSFSRTNENENVDTLNLNCKEKIKKEYEYVGNSIDVGLNSELERTNENRYDCAIDGINKLIDKFKESDEIKKEKKPKFRRLKHKRSASAGSNRSQSSSSDDDKCDKKTKHKYSEFLTNKKVKNCDLKNERCRNRWNTQAQDINNNNLNGDQTIAINKVVVPKTPTTPTSIDPTSRILSSKSDEVLLRLVSRLASLHNQNTLTNVSENDNHKTQQQINSINQYLLQNLNISNSNNENQENEFLVVEPNVNNKTTNDVEKDRPLISELLIENQNQLNNNCASIDEVDDSNMGSNVSRHTGKGLSGRRSQSSGNLCNGKQSSSTTTHNNTTTKNDIKSKTKISKKNLPTNTNTEQYQQQQQINENLNTNRKFFNNKNNSKTKIVSTTSTGRNHPDTTLQNVEASGTDNDDDDVNLDESCSVIMAPLCASIKDRKKLCGSLPNHLDSDDICDDDVQRNPNLYYGDNCNPHEHVEYVTVAPRKQLYHQQMLDQQQQHHQYQLQHLQQQFSQQNPTNSSPYNNSSSGKGSITSSTNLGSSSFKNNNDNRPDLQLKLPILRANNDAGCDQGYGSERSPEDEIPPPMPLMMLENLHHFSDGNLLTSAGGMPLPQYVHQNWNITEHEYNFITKDCTFAVHIIKGPRGLGLSVSGGSDSNAVFPGLIRIKRLFPHQAAWSTGMLQPGDILLEVNGISLTGLTNYDALEVLRTTPNNVELIVCRPRDERYRKLSPPTEPPKPPQRNSLQGQQINSNTIPLEPLSPIMTHFTGEFEIILTKQQSSLGFTLRKEDESVLGHYVRALVRDPALNDGRIKAGDKIVAVNDIPLSPMTHEEAVIFLRQAADTVKLRLFRDAAQTPVAALSPTSNENKTFCNTLTKRAHLRPEAINLLSDLAYRKQTPDDSTDNSLRSNTTTPSRRLKRGTRNNTSTSSNQKYLVSSQTSTCSDSETSTLSQCSFIVQPATPSEFYESDQFSRSNSINQHNQHEIVNQLKPIEDNNLEYYEEDELFQMVDEIEDSDGRMNSNRPNFLDLLGQSGSTPVVSRKPRFQFSIAANSYELNNLDNEALDAPIYNGSNESRRCDENSGSGLKIVNNLNENIDSYNSLPCETFLVACMTESDLNNSQNFNHKKPVYQSAVIQPNKDGGSSISGVSGCSGIGGLPQNDNSDKKDGTKSLIKWKGVMFSPDEEKTDETPTTIISLTTPGTDSSGEGTLATTSSENYSNGDVSSYTGVIEGYKAFVVELNRGWNSRLGFSLQEDHVTKRTIISAIHNDSVAAKDGRLKVGDQLVMVNDESIEHMHTNDIIDLLRIIRGLICLTIVRKESTSSATNESNYPV